MAVSIIAVLLSILLPSLKPARTSARIVRAHVELRQIDLALQMYADACQGALPPTRFSCALRTDYELPLELGGQKLLPLRPEYVTVGNASGLVTRVLLPDVFDKSVTYRYRAPGTAIINESQVEPNMSSLWVPTAFPDVSDVAGQYYFSSDAQAANADRSPVRYAIWSIGPDARSRKFSTPGIPKGRGPVPSFFWCRGASDSGVVTHYQARNGRVYQSP